MKMQVIDGFVISLVKHVELKEKSHGVGVNNVVGPWLEGGWTNLLKRIQNSFCFVFFLILSSCLSFCVEGAKDVFHVFFCCWT